MWFHDHHYLISLPSLFTQCFLLVTLIVTISLIFQLTLPKPGDYNQLVECFNLQRIPLLISGAIFTCLVVLLAILILPVKDAFFIKGELTIAAFVIPPFLIVFLILEWLDLIPDLKFLLPLAAMVLSFAIIIPSPLFLTFKDRQLALRVKNAKNTSFGGLSSLEIFEICLSNPTLFEAFRLHCFQSFCVENPLFYRDCQRYRELEEKLRKSEIFNLKSLYLKEGCRLLINIARRTRTTLLEEIEKGNCPRDLFDVAMQEVFQQMYQDTFPKFKVSSRFKEAWKKVKNDKHSTLRSSKLVVKENRPGDEEKSSIIPLTERGEALLSI